jgi:hypothetical protein
MKKNQAYVKYAIIVDLVFLLHLMYFWPGMWHTIPQMVLDLRGWYRQGCWILAENVSTFMTILN